VSAPRREVAYSGNVEVGRGFGEEEIKGNEGFNKLRVCWWGAPIYLVEAR
jgi:hypothetical protein